MIINWGDAPFKAFITVTYPGGTCTVTGEGQTYTHTGGGTKTFTVKKKGTYTVKATDGSLTASTSSSISKRGQAATATLSYSLVLLPNSSYSTIWGNTNGSSNSSYASSSVTSSTMTVRVGDKTYARVQTKTKYTLPAGAKVSFKVSSFTNAAYGYSPTSHFYISTASPTSTSGFSVSKSISATGTFSFNVDTRGDYYIGLLNTIGKVTDYSTTEYITTAINSVTITK